MEFFRELACACTGEDCGATAAWLAAYMADHEQAAACKRAALHWQRAPEELQAALASQLGFTAPNGEAWPVVPAIRRDYETALAVASGALEYF